MTIYECLSRSLPFTLNKSGPTEGIALATAVAQNGYRPDVDGEWDAVLVSIMQSCWKQEPKDRPRMTNVAAQIERWLESSVSQTMSATGKLQALSFNVQKSMSQVEVYELWKLRELKNLHLVSGDEQAQMSSTSSAYVTLGRSLGKGSFAQVYLVEIGSANHAAKVFNSELIARQIRFCPEPARD